MSWEGVPTGGPSAPHTLRSLPFLVVFLLRRRHARLAAACFAAGDDASAGRCGMMASSNCTRTRRAHVFDGAHPGWALEAQACGKTPTPPGTPCFAAFVVTIGTVVFRGRPMGWARGERCKLRAWCPNGPAAASPANPSSSLPWRSSTPSPLYARATCPPGLPSDSLVRRGACAPGGSLCVRSSQLVRRVMAVGLYKGPRRVVLHRAVGKMVVGLPLSCKSPKCAWTRPPGGACSVLQQRVPDTVTRVPAPPRKASTPLSPRAAAVTAAGPTAAAAAAAAAPAALGSRPRRPSPLLTPLVPTNRAPAPALAPAAPPALAHRPPRLLCAAVA